MVFGRTLRSVVGLAMGLLSFVLVSHATQASAVDTKAKGKSKAAVHYLEIVSNDVDALVGLYQRMHGLSFGSPEPDLGNARVATQADGTLVGIRMPLAPHEAPIVRTYIAVEDIGQAVKVAEAHGATVAYGPTIQGRWGNFAIVIQGEVQHGLWQP